MNLFGQDTKVTKPKIEIYFLNNASKIYFAQLRDNYFNQPANNYFLPTAEQLSEIAFISDDEITGYKIYQDTSKQKRGELYSFILSKSAQEKINHLKNIPLCCGEKFAVVLNGKPIFGAYFWNLVSSFGCTWLTAFACSNEGLYLMKGLPENYFDETKQDPRNDKALIEAFKSTGRLKEK